MGRLWRPGVPRVIAPDQTPPPGPRRAILDGATYADGTPKTEIPDTVKAATNEILQEHLQEAKVSGRIFLPGGTRPGERPELIIPGRPPRRPEPERRLEVPGDAVLPGVRLDGAPMTAGEFREEWNSRMPEGPSQAPAADPRKVAAQAVAQEHVQAIKEGRPPRSIGEILRAVAPVAGAGAGLAALVAAAISAMPESTTTADPPRQR